MTADMNISGGMDSSESESSFKSLYLYNAVREVMHSMTGLTMQEVKIEGAEDIQFKAAHITGVLFMMGSSNVVIQLSIPTTAAYVFVSAITGIDMFNINEEILYDGIMELTNILAGKIKAQLVQAGMSYTISPPYLLHGDNYGVYYKKKQSNIVKKYRAGKMELLLRIFFL